MYDNYNYPPGADNEYAPWNEPSVPEKEFGVTCCQTLSKTVTVYTDNYTPGAEGVDYESDDEGGYTAVGWHDDDDTSDTDWAEEYHANDYHTPLQLIELFKRYLEHTLDDKVQVSTSTSYIKHLIEECEDWSEDETEYVED
jgi:hypothetical protein